MKNKILLNIVLIFVIIVFSSIVFSHLDAGQDKVVDNYKVDFGYSPENPNTNDKVAIALTLFDTNQEVIEPDSVWVRISSSKEVIFAGTLKPKNGNAAFTYKFPYAGNYEITSRFIYDKETIVEINFIINIEKTSNLEIYYLIFAIIALIILTFVIIKLKSLKNKLK